MIPDEIDLTLPDDDIAKQPVGNMCHSFGPANALEIMANRHPDWKGKKFSPWFLYWYGRQYQGGTGDTGIRPVDARQALSRYGICELKDFHPSDIETAPDLVANMRAQMMMPIDYWYMPYYQDDIRLSLIRSLCFGIPLVIDMVANTDFSAPVPGTSWRMMDHDATAGGGFDHALVVVGYSKHYDTFKCKNSWGPDKGDGGYFGLKAEKFYHGPQKAVHAIWRIEKSPIPPVKVDGFMPGIPTLTKEECRDFVSGNKPARRVLLEAALVSGGALGLRDECIRMNVSDKLLEEDLGLQRGDAQGWFQSQNIPQGAMIWLPLI